MLDFTTSSVYENEKLAQSRSFNLKARLYYI